MKNVETKFKCDNLGHFQTMCNSAAQQSKTQKKQM